MIRTAYVASGFEPASQPASSQHPLESGDDGVDLRLRPGKARPAEMDEGRQKSEG